MCALGLRSRSFSIIFLVAVVKRRAPRCSRRGDCVGKRGSRYGDGGADAIDGISAEKAGAPHDAAATEGVAAAVFALFVDLHIWSFHAVYVVRGAILIVLILIRVLPDAILGLPGSGSDSGDL